ncbi:DUF6544 family protein [Maribacter sp. 2307ULW6-5]|uniref:DUF6544 family protein n=1 Tax=Maribacter sp. 2307ULW6-5 TaxID=3386275 RepID=UPI0039BC5CA5
MRTLLVLLLMVHGAIHLMGFAKGFDLGNVGQFSRDISRPMGLLWLVAGCLFLLAGFLYGFQKDSWAAVALAAVVLSQGLIVATWADAKWGTLANALLLAFAVVAWASQRFEQRYAEAVQSALQASAPAEERLTESDLAHLPTLVQQYIRRSGALGKPKVRRMTLFFEGQMRDRGKDWFSFTAEQHSFFDRPARHFFMKAKIMGLPAYGYHAYTQGQARMQVKLLSLFPVVAVEGPELSVAETVTYFNDLCLFAPAALIDPRIAWEPHGERSVTAHFSYGKNRIAAVLHFNEAGQLVNFTSNDRLAVDQMKRHPFSTPVARYRNFNGHELPGYGEAIWHYPEGAFVYGKFHLKDMAYNQGER